MIARAFRFNEVKDTKYAADGDRNQDDRRDQNDFVDAAFDGLRIGLGRFRRLFLFGFVLIGHAHP